MSVISANQTASQQRMDLLLAKLLQPSGSDAPTAAMETRVVQLEGAMTTLHSKLDLLLSKLDK